MHTVLARQHESDKNNKTISTHCWIILDLMPITTSIYSGPSAHIYLDHRHHRKNSHHFTEMCICELKRQSKKFVHIARHLVVKDESMSYAVIRVISNAKVNKPSIN